MGVARGFWVSVYVFSCELLRALAFANSSIFLGQAPPPAAAVGVLPDGLAPTAARGEAIAPILTFLGEKKLEAV